jgi:tRNA(Ile)-lysidine synthase
MIAPGHLVLVAVSGGADSTTLLHALNALREDLQCELHVAHLNHQLRGAESDNDAQFVKDMAGSLGIPFTCRTLGEDWAARVKGMSLEEAARDLRYEILEEVAREAGAHRIATGHTADDQAETVLMRILRGAGPGGLGGIRPVRDGRIIRPLLFCRASEMRDYAEAASLSPRIDSSNQDPRFLRNRIRHRLVPILEQEFNPGIVRALGRISAVERDVDRYLREAAKNALETMAESSTGKIGLALDRFRDYDRILQAYILRAAIEEIRGHLADISLAHIRAVLRLAQEQETPFRQVALPDSLVAYLERDLLVLDRAGETGRPEEQEVAVPGTTRAPDFGLKLQTLFLSSAGPTSPVGTSENVAHLDWEALRPPLRVRGWRDGDRFRPLGMDGRKKLQDFFVDEKIPRSLRKRMPLLVDQETIHWVIGYRTSEESKISDETKRILQVKAVPLTA